MLTSPRILEDPVLRAARSVVANELDAMIEHAVTIVEDARRVELPRVTIDADRDGPSDARRFASTSSSPGSRLTGL